MYDFEHIYDKKLCQRRASTIINQSIFGCFWFMVFSLWFFNPNPISLMNIQV